MKVLCIGGIRDGQWIPCDHEGGFFQVTSRHQLHAAGSPIEIMVDTYRVEWIAAGDWRTRVLVHHQMKIDQAMQALINCYKSGDY